jgi:hypothetical protein
MCPPDPKEGEEEAMPDEYSFFPREPSSDVQCKEFEFHLHYMKALPVGEEPAIVLVSCAGNVEAMSMVADPFMASRIKRIEIKRRGELSLRLSGVGYMIVRPGPMMQEPGGYRAMIFDQGERIARVRLAWPPLPYPTTMTRFRTGNCDQNPSTI